MIRLKPLLIESRQYNITMSDDEIRQYIESTPGFKKRFEKRFFHSNVKAVRDALKFKEEVNSGKWLLPNDPRKLIYRGRDPKIQHFEIASIRQDRKPLHTDQLSNVLLNVYGASQNKAVPERSRVKFGVPAPYKGVTTSYGQTHVAFPLKTAKVFSSKVGDTGVSVADVGNPFDRARKLEPKRSNVSSFFELIEHVIPRRSWVKETLRVVISTENLPSIDFIKGWPSEDVAIAELKDARDDFNATSLQPHSIDEQDRDFIPNVIDEVIEMFKAIKRYYSNWERGVSSTTELMYDGKEHLVVNADFFEVFFTLGSSGKVEYNDEFKKFLSLQ